MLTNETPTLTILSDSIRLFICASVKQVHLNTLRSMVIGQKTIHPSEMAVSLKYTQACW